MIAVLQSPPSSLSCIPGDGSGQSETALSSDPPTAGDGQGREEADWATRRKGSQRVAGGRRGRKREEEDHLSLSSLLVAVVRKSLVGCRTETDEDLRSMEIGWPTNVQHVAHVTFDRFHGFLGLPVEFEPEVPRRAPSASASVFGVSTKSMQCSYDPRGNSVPTILLLMQRRLYEQGGLQAEGIFRINAENSQEEHVRDQLNSGIVPDGIDVHCLAGLIKAWFRELPTGVLDSLAPEQVMQCQTEEECAHLVKLLPPTEAALFDWALNLMADVVLAEPHNKMNARNVAMVFAPNMTQMADPLSALMYAVQVMNFLKTLILRTLKERRQEPLLGPPPSSSSSRPDPPDEDGPLLDAGSPDEEAAPSPAFVSVEPNSDGPAGGEKPVSKFSGQFSGGRPCEPPTSSGSSSSGCAGGGSASRRTRVAAQTGKHPRKETKKSGGAAGEKSRGISLVSRINSRMERVETWR